jgi:hypothetical protein
MTTAGEARAPPAQHGRRHHRRIHPGRPRGRSDAERVHRLKRTQLATDNS